MASQPSMMASAQAILGALRPRVVADLPTASAEYLSRLEGLISRWWFAYPTLWLFQLKVIWGDWNYRDMAFGDTSNYFMNAARWFQAFVVDVMWSPLYTAFYGSLLYLSPDAFVITELHRLILVFAGVTLILVAMRRLLPHGVAWVIAAWWAVLHVNYDVMYEVHLFGALMIVAVVATILGGRGPWTRGAALAVLVATTLLVRNELSVSAIVLALICAAWEGWTAMRGESCGTRAGWPSLAAAITAYVVPLLAAFALFLFFYSRSWVDPPNLAERSLEKHTISLCQIYAYGYQERHPGAWPKSPWTQCHELMVEHFGKREPTFGEALRANPSAALEHVAWNLSLTPAGLQAALFNAIAGTTSPDFIQIKRRPALATLLSVLLALVLAIGGVVLLRDRSYWWRSWLRERVWGWLALGAVSIPSFLIMPMLRPRPEYLYGLTFLLMAAAGMSLAVIARRWLGLGRLHAFAPALVILAVLLVPNHYADPAHLGERSRLTMYERLRPYFPLLADSRNVVMQPGFSELQYFVYGMQLSTLGSSMPLTQTVHSRPVHYSMLGERTPGEPLEVFLEQHGINLIYMDGALLQMLEQDPGARTMLTSPDSVGWTVIGAQEAPGARWRLLQKRLHQESNVSAPQTAVAGLPSRDTVAPPPKIGSFPDDLRLPGVRPAGLFEDGWTEERAIVELTAPDSGMTLLIRGLVPLIEDPSFRSELRVFIDGQEVARQPLGVGEFEVDVPSPPGSGTRRIELQFSQLQELPGADGRDVAALIRYIGFAAMDGRATITGPITSSVLSEEDL